MESSMNNIHIVFIVNDLGMLETLSEYIQKLGFTVHVSSSEEDITDLNNNNPLRFIRISTSKTKDVLHPELRNMLDCLSSKTTSIIIALQDLSFVKICHNSQNRSLYNHLTLSEIEREYIITTLNKCGWRFKTAAKLLGIDRTTLYRKMKKYDITKK